MENHYVTRPYTATYLRRSQGLPAIEEHSIQHPDTGEQGSIIVRDDGRVDFVSCRKSIPEEHQEDFMSWLERFNHIDENNLRPADKYADTDEWLQYLDII